MSRVLLIFVIFGVVQLGCAMSHGFGPYNFPHGGFGHGHFDHGEYDHDDFHHGPDDFHHDHSPEDCSGSSSSSKEDTTSYDWLKERFSIATLAFRQYCEKSNKVTPSIMYGQDAYIIKYALPNQSNLNITVKTVNRLIMTEVKEQGDFKGFQDVRILPEMLDLQRAFWSIEQSNLKIMLPYKVTISAEFNAVCEPDNGEVNIPATFTPRFKVRMLTP